ncbi:unnamed protein product [Haemonchus placei]|uniref:Transposase n=1 Tax=Haemonchus placei TaxID=6290 RepID=A0A0N4VVW2_HAEPC|nr:unnamed protein product [Haemonchus placei]
MGEARLRWYGHILRAKNDSVRKIGLNLDVTGKQPRGRPKQWWLDTLHEGLKACDGDRNAVTAGVTRLDRISNDAIRERFGVAPIVDKMGEARLRWYGHILRAKNDSVRKIGLNLDVTGKQPRGRPKQWWLDTLHEGLKAVNIHPDQAFNREK